MTNKRTPRSTGSDRDWIECRSWRRMFLAVQDEDTDKARDALRYVAVTFAGLALSHADTCQAQRLAAGARDAAKAGELYQALSASLSAFKAARGSAALDDHERELCGLIRAVWPRQPESFAGLGAGGRSGPSSGGEDGYVPPRHVAHIPGST